MYFVFSGVFRLQSNETYVLCNEFDSIDHNSINLIVETNI